MASIMFPRTNDNLSYLTISDSYANDNTLDIWIKFTEHLKQDELLLINKDISSLSQLELDKYNSIKKQLNMSLLFRKYKNKECTKEEHDFVLSYMHNSLKSFVKNRMTNEEQSSAYSFISTLSKDEIIEYINQKEEKYDELSAYEAYVLFIAKEQLYNKEQTEYNKKREQEELKIILKRKNKNIKHN